MLNPRVDRLFAALQTSTDFQALVLNPGPTLFYLTGLNFHLMERPVVTIFTAARSCVMILPELEVSRAQKAALPVQFFPYNDNPATWGDAFKRAAAALAADGLTLGVEPTRLRFLEMRFLEEALPKSRFTSAHGLLSGLRIAKDAGEIAAMRKAVDIAQRGLEATLALTRAGMTEREVASELVLQLLRVGSDAELPFGPIVASGPNAADPHATPGERRLQNGDLLIVDWGAAADGYVSDLTRTFAIGEVEPELKKIVEIVRQANEAGRLAGKPGLPAGAVDQATRKVIDDAGYGVYFNHRTGHGLGLEGHEEPYMFGENKLLLTEGMTYTVEPGIYFVGRGGCRIEDNVVVTASGAETLSSMPRELRQIG